MSSSLMHESNAVAHAAADRPGVSAGAASGVQRLAAGAGPRWLRVDDGQLWLTRSEHSLRVPQPGDDVWLGAGDRMMLPAGSEWLAEAWPQARWALSNSPQALPPPGPGLGERGRRKLLRWLGGRGQSA